MGLQNKKTRLSYLIPELFSFNPLPDYMFRIFLVYKEAKYNLERISFDFFQMFVSTY